MKDDFTHDNHLQLIEVVHSLGTMTKRASRKRGHAGADTTKDDATNTRKKATIKTVVKQEQIKEPDG